MMFEKDLLKSKRVLTTGCGTGLGRSIGDRTSRSAPTSYLRAARTHPQGGSWPVRARMGRCANAVQSQSSLGETGHWLQSRAFSLPTRAPSLSLRPNS